MNATLEQGFHVEHQEAIDLRIFDPAFRHAYNIEAPEQGDEVDGIFYEILTSPAGLRALGINQLSKSPEEETYAGSADFKRWQHVAGVYRLVRHFGRQQKLSQEEILQYALVACVPDLGHGVKSHVTDMLHEGMGWGGESFHDLRVRQLIDLGGIGNILQKHNIKSPFKKDGTRRINVPNWVECDSPDLCVDRLHYINAEISLMFPDNEAVQDAIKLENITITEDGNMAFKDPDKARVWAKAANLCSSEHWNDPINRLIEMLSLEAMKRTIGRRYLENVGTFDNGYVGIPEDYTYLIDVDFDRALDREATGKEPDPFMNTVYSLIQSIAHRERQRFEKHKKPVYEKYLEDDDAREYPNALVHPHRASFGTPPASVGILKRSNNNDGLRPHDATLRFTDGKTVGTLKQLKVRQFDPLVVTPQGTKRLSKIDCNFKKALKDNGRALKYMGSVTLHANPESEAALIDGVQENCEYMERSRKYKSLSPDQIREIIRSSGARALDLAKDNRVWVELN